MAAHPALTDPGHVSPVRMLADGVRGILDAVPVDQLPGLPAGRLTVERSYFAELHLESIQDTTAAVRLAEWSTQFSTRERRQFQSIIEIDIARKLASSPKTAAGAAELAAFMDWSDAVAFSVMDWSTIRQSGGDIVHTLQGGIEATELDPSWLASSVALITLQATYNTVAKMVRVAQ